MSLEQAACCPVCCDKPNVCPHCTLICKTGLLQQASWCVTGACSMVCRLCTGQQVCSVCQCRDQAYAMRTWDKSPSIDNYTFHPFMTQVGGAEANTANSVPVSPPTSPPPESSSTPVTNGVSSTVAKALAPPSGGGQKRAAEQFSRATTTPAEPAQLFDLLSMDEVSAARPARCTFYQSLEAYMLPMAYALQQPGMQRLLLTGGG